MVSETLSVPWTLSSAPDFIDIKRFFTREKAKPRTLYVYLYSCNPAIEDSLITSRRTVVRYIAASYEFYAAQLAESLQSAISMIHFSSDLWTSPHRHGMLAVCGQWVDKGYKLRKALLDLLECRKGHSGESQAGLIADVLGRYEIRSVGYHTGDNASSNSTCLEALSKKLLHERGIIFDSVRRRARCFGHTGISNFSLQAFLLTHSKDTLRATLNAAGNDAGAQSIETFSTALNENTPSGPDTTVDHTSEENQGRQQRPPTRERTTQLVEFSGWEGINALQKLRHLAFWIGSSSIHSDNWREAPFTEATLITEGDKASLCSTLRLMDGLLSHFEKAKIHYSNPKFHDSRMFHSIEMGWFVLDKYYTMSDEAPVYVAALLLDPRCRKAYLDKNWKKTTPEDIPAALGKLPSQLQLMLEEMEVETALSTDSDNLDAFINSPAIKIDCKPLEWWCRIEQRRQFPRLSRMAIDILSDRIMGPALDDLRAAAGS
ncbi:hypothetical protein LZL87_013687 [Fusarium oxysporum]|nr:hypothetical protein LZL87_013687 [Fusarium oxysporum]